MLGLNLNPNPRFRIPNPKISTHNNPILPPHHLPITARPRIRNARRRIAVRAEEKEKPSGEVKGEEDDELKRPIFNFDLSWRELLLNPDRDNVVAVGLAGLLTWASVQVVWQLLIVSLAILVAALKYSFIAALLLFILIALL